MFPAEIGWEEKGVAVGTVFSFRVIPDQNYKVRIITMVLNGESVILEADENGYCSFEMPHSEVEIRISTISSSFDQDYEGYPISSKEDLADLEGAAPGIYTLVTDLTLEGWTPVKLPADVVFNGNNHAILGLTTALFSEVHGTVKDLTIEDANIVGTTAPSQSLLATTPYL